MGTDVRLYLKQLEPDELNMLGKYVQAKIPKSSTKGKLVDILYSHHVSKQDVIKFLSKPTGRTGIYAKYDGEAYEKKVMGFFQKEGYDCTLNVRPSRGTEFDIIGKKGWNFASMVSNKSMIVVECKNQPIVTNADLQKFAGKFNGFKHQNEDDVSADFHWMEIVKKKAAIRGIIATSGIFEPLAKEEAKKHDDIELKRLRF